ncbi:MAG: hypothetical protein NT003_04340 [Candidatus Magasanikbacteria bacterium]|nr:hypothetical protein [Candidatus Magasanikbacteria bacterium]
MLRMIKYAWIFTRRQSMATLDVTALRQLENEAANDPQNSSLRDRFNAAMNAVAQQIFYGSDTGDPLLDYLIYAQKTTNPEKLKKLHDTHAALKKRRGEMLIHLFAPVQLSEALPAVIVRTNVTGVLKTLPHPPALAIETEVGLTFHVPHGSFVHETPRKEMYMNSSKRADEKLIAQLCKDGTYIEPRGTQSSPHNFWTIGSEVYVLEQLRHFQHSNNLGYNFVRAM